MRSTSENNFSFNTTHGYTNNLTERNKTDSDEGCNDWVKHSTSSSTATTWRNYCKGCEAKYFTQLIGGNKRTENCKFEGISPSIKHMSIILLYYLNS